MGTAKPSEATTGIPEGYLAIPVSDSNHGATLRLCVLVRQTPDPAAGHFVLLRDLPDALVYLACVTDAGGRLREWIELWVQNVDGLESSLPTLREAFSNQVLDERWAKHAEGFRELYPESLLQTGWESSHPLPTFLDLSQARAVPLGHDTQAGTWQLCRDDGQLQAAGLPPYSTSLFRYLHQPASGNSARFIPVVTAAPSNAATLPLTEALGNTDAHLPFNAQGGLIMALNFHPLGYDEYVDLLGGKPWKGIGHGKKHFTFDGVYRSLGDWNQIQQSGAHLFLGFHGRGGRFPETFHLKLQLLTEAVRLARSVVLKHQLPFLNLGVDSFRVRLGELGSQLPFLWTARCALAKPSHAFALPVESSDFRYFIRARTDGPSIYLPEGLSIPLQSSGSVRLRKILPPDLDRTTLEGTLVMPEKLPVSPHDLLWIRLPLPAGRVDLYGHLYSTEGLAQGEARFRTVPQRLPEKVLTALRAAEGVSFARSPFEVVPLLSSPCDLHSLGVMAVRTFLVNDETTLPVSLDEILSLARQVATEHKAGEPLGRRIRSIFERDPRYLASLGPHRLLRENCEADQGFKLLPAELWYDTLAVIVSMFPGLGPDSVCRDFGDVPSLALETVFNRPLEELEKLLIRSRSLIIIDWNYNREIHSAIKEYLHRNKSLAE